MKKIYLYLFLFTFLFLSLGQEQAKASHAMGCDISYRHIFGDLYEFTLTFYRDCDGISAPVSPSLNINSASCGSSNFLSLTLTGSGTEVSPLCPAQLGNSTCNGGTIPGVEQYVYTGTFTLPSQCDDWVISFSDCNRNSLITNILDPDFECIYVEAHLDNLNVTSNNSPQFTTLPVPYICEGQSFTYNHGAFDPDGDSLVYSLINALTSGGVAMTYVAPANATYPIIDTRGFNVFDPATGSMNVIPNGTQVAVIAVLVEEYRNGVLIGSTIRDIQVVVQACSNVQPQDAQPGLYNQIGGVNVDGNSVQVCPGEALSFNVRFSDANGGDNVTLTTNLASVIPGATFTTSGTNPVTGTFSWTPTGSDAGFHNFTVTVQDDGCPILGSQVFAYDILVQSGTYAGADETLCPGGVTPQLSATGGTTFTWSVLSGSPISVPANFSCNPCSNPIPSPAATTTYIVTSNLSGACKNKDTVTVNVTPGFTLTMPSNQTICLNEAVNLPLSTSAGTYTYNWTPAGSLDNPTISNPLAGPTATTTYTATVTNTTTGCTNQGTVNVTISGVGPGVLISNDTNICAGQSVPLLATPYSTECDNYSVSSIAYSATGGGSWTTLTGGDTWVSAAIPLGFTFDFYCDSYTEVYFSSNGSLNFTSTSSYPSVAIPNTSTPNNFIGFAMEDLVSTTMRYKSTASYFVAQYQGYYWSPGSGSSSVSAEIRLYSDGSNNIEIHIQDNTPAGQTPVCGIENSDGTMGLSPTGRNYGSSWTASNEAWRFSYPQTTGPYSYTWTGGLSSVANPTATPATTTNYIVDVLDTGTGCTGTASVNVTVGANYNLSTTSNTTICYGSSIGLSTTPSIGGTYSYSWSPNSSLLGPFTSTPTASPTSATTYTVTVNNGGCVKTDNVTIDVAGSPVIASSDEVLICPGETVQLDVAATPATCGTTTACGGSSSVLTVGAGASSTSTTPYEGFYHDGRMQILYTAADLTSMGLTPGVITAIGFNVATKGSTQSYNNFTIKMMGTTAGSLGGYLSGLDVVYGPTSYTVSGTGWQTHTLDVPFSWNGTCDVVVEICFDNSSYTDDDDVYYTTTPYTSVVYSYADASAVGGCNETQDGTTTSRPNTRFTLCTSSLPGGATYSWTGGTVSNSTIQNPTATPTSTTTYSVTVTDPLVPACPSNSSIQVVIDSTVYVDAQTNDNSVCGGQTANLLASMTGSPLPGSIPCGANGTSAGTTTIYTIGTGTSVATTGSPFYGGWEDNRVQHLISAAELTASGLTSGTIDRISLYVGTKNSTQNYSGLTIKMGCTTDNSLSTSTGWLATTTVRNAANYATVANSWNHFILTNTFDWDGTSNIVIEWCFNNNSYTGSDQIYYYTPGYTGTMYNYCDGCAAGCSLTPTSTSSFLPRYRFRHTPAPPNPFVYSWSPGTGLSSTTVANPTFTGDGNDYTFTCTVTGGLCTVIDTVNIYCIMPVQFISFEAIKNESTVNLSWKNAGDYETEYYIVERSNNGEDFVEIGKVNALQQNDMLYLFNDENPLVGDGYYRIKAIDYNNQVVYSDVRKVTDESKIRVYPNPVKKGNELVILYNTQEKSASVELIELSGKIVLSEIFDNHSGLNNKMISTQHLAEGTYLYRIVIGNEVEIGKVIIEK